MGWTVLVLLIATAVAGCIGGTEDADLEGAGEDDTGPPTETTDGNRTEILQEATASWLTGTDRCAGAPGPIQLGPESEGLTKDTIGISPDTYEQPFTAKIDSQQAPLSWGILFLGLDGGMMILTEVQETEGDVLEGIVPDDTMEATFFSCAGLEHEVQFTVVAGW